MSERKKRIIIEIDKKAAISIKKELNIDLEKGLQMLADKLVRNFSELVKYKKTHPDLDLKKIAEMFKDASAKD